MTQPQNNKPKLSATAVKHELWRRGVLTWLLDSNQKELYNLFHSTGHRVQTWLLARRSGKSYALLVFAIEQCMKQPNSIVKYVAPTKLQITTILRDIIKQILKDCPEDIKPSFSQRDYTYYFKNGSEIQLAGAESGHYIKLRGGSSHIAIVDEAQDVTDLKDVIRSVLLPTTLTTNGKVLLSGTPPKNPDHDFVYYIEEAELKGSLIRKTVEDNPRLTKEQVALFIEEVGGRNSEECRRELFCELIKDVSTSVIPEFTKEIQEAVIKEWPRPPFFDAYVSMDFGAIDLTGLLFGYYDFRSAKIIIEDELCLDFTEANMNLDKLATLIKEKEAKLWYNPISNEQKKPYLRLSDLDYIVMKELAIKSANTITFVPTKKDDKEAAINNLRALIGSKKLIIHPRCVNLIRHLDNVKWSSAKNKHTFARSPDNGHYDLVDACVYLVRNVLFSKNPYPPTYDLKMDSLYIHDPKTFNKKTTANLEEVYYRIFNIKRNK